MFHPPARLLKYILPLLVLTMGARASFAATDLTDGLYHVDFPAQDLNEIQQLLPENGGLNPAFISNNTDPNIHLLAEAAITMTFIDEEAGYKNSFGYFVYDDENILYQQSIFSNAFAAGSGSSLLAGDTVSLGTFNEKVTTSGSGFRLATITIPTGTNTTVETSTTRMACATSPSLTTRRMSDGSSGLRTSTTWVTRTTTTSCSPSRAARTPPSIRPESPPGARRLVRWPPP